MSQVIVPNSGGCNETKLLVWARTDPIPVNLESYTDGLSIGLTMTVNDSGFLAYESKGTCWEDQADGQGFFCWGVDSN